MGKPPLNRRIAQSRSAERRQAEGPESLENRRQAAQPRKKSRMTSRSLSIRRSNFALRGFHFPSSDCAYRSQTARDQVNLDDTAARQMRDPDCGPCGQPAGFEIFGVDAIERSIVALEIGEKDAHADDMFVARTDAGERAL